jgi:hypothetical protein
MTYQELLKEAAGLKCDESRARLDNYFEIVVSKTDLPPAEALLRSYFGDPLKPAGVSVPADLALLTRPYGGVQINQTAYLFQGLDRKEFAFLWPWSNGLSITIKIMIEKK